jgi:hypothetical protein
MVLPGIQTAQGSNAALLPSFFKLFSDLCCLASILGLARPMREDLLSYTVYCRQTKSVCPEAKILLQMAVYHAIP